MDKQLDWVVGILEKNGIKKVEAYHSSDGWTSGRGKITKDGDRIDIGLYGADISLKRK